MQEHFPLVGDRVFEEQVKQVVPDEHEAQF